MRPLKCRKVRCKPDSNYFKPRGVSLGALQELALGIDEFEAVRLADFEGLYQEAAAKRMKISRQTFGNLIVSAHRKIADCLVNAKALKIEARPMAALRRRCACRRCGNAWQKNRRKDGFARCLKCEKRDRVCTRKKNSLLEGKR